MTSQRQQERTDKHPKRAMVLILLSAVVFAVVLVLQVMTIRSEVSRATHDLISQNIEASSADLRQSMEVLVGDYTYWDEALFHVVHSLDTAWLIDNYGKDLETTFHVSAVFFVYPHGNVSRVVDGALQAVETSSPEAAALVGSLRDLATQSRNQSPPRDAKPVPASAYLSVNNDLMVASAAEIRPTSHQLSYRRDDVPSVIFLRPVDDEWLEQLAQRLSLRHLSVLSRDPSNLQVISHPHDTMHPEGTPSLVGPLFSDTHDFLASSIALNDTQGLELARLEFVPPNMTPSIMAPTMLAGIAASALLAVLGILLMRQIAQTARSISAQNERLHYEVNCRLAAEQDLLKHQEELEQTVAERSRALSREVERTNALLHDLEGSLERVQRIIDTSNEGFMHLDIAGRVIGLNQKAQQILGYDTRELIGKTIEGLLTPHGLTIFQEQMRLRPSTQFRSYTLEVQAKDGSILTLDVMASSEFENGALSGSFAFFRDIREQIEREQAMKKAKESAVIANNTKSTFLTQLSHELRTPLNAILGFSQLLMGNKTSPLPPRQQEQAARIRQAAESLLHLINELLDMSRIESGQITLKPETLSPFDAVRESLRLASVLAEQMGVSLNFDASAESNVEASLLLRADRGRLQQILLNLISNAIKYNRAGGHATVSVAALNNKQCRLRVEDSGIGIPENLLQQVFLPFNRLGQERGTIEGSGIGLSICKKLAEAMGGDITVERLSEGTAFNLDLPLASGDRSTP